MTDEVTMTTTIEPPPVVAGVALEVVGRSGTLYGGCG